MNTPENIHTEFHRMLGRDSKEAQLQQRGIAGAYEAGIYTGGGHEQPFFAMEYIPGARSLTDYAKDEDLDVKARLDLFMQICDAIHHGHQKGIIHRDLKPENILMSSPQDDANIKIADFGFARYMAQQALAETLCGSPLYMAPEALRGGEWSTDPRATIACTPDGREFDCGFCGWRSQVKTGANSTRRNWIATASRTPSTPWANTRTAIPRPSCTISSVPTTSPPSHSGARPSA